MSEITREQVERWRKICLSHWITDAEGKWVTPKENARQANALCDLALCSLPATGAGGETPLMSAQLAALKDERNPDVIFAMFETVGKQLELALKSAEAAGMERAAKEKK